jgi:hypothetical protein
MNPLKRAVTNWPPIIWPLMTFGSLLILVGSSGRVDPPLVVAGAVLALVVCAVSLYLALKGWPERPRPAIVVWAIAGVVVFYVLVGLAAAAAGLEYGLVGVAAGVIPLSAVALLLATMRSRTAESGGRLRDDSGDPDHDRAPGLGMDDQTPLGDTPDHSDSFDQPDVTPSGRWEHPAANRPGTRARSSRR